ASSGNLPRRSLRQLAAGGAGAAAGNLLTLDHALGQTEDTAVAPPDGGRFKDLELTYAQDSGWLHAPLWLSPIFMKDAGVGIKNRQQYDDDSAMSQVLPELLAPQPH